jgi:NTP pyrophosphatase (non-canonical NTP hydrolase)
MDDKQTTIGEIRNIINSFSRERQWDVKENPKDLAMALAVEVAEVLEIFQWLHSDQADSIKNNVKEYEHLQEEIADVFWYLMRICEHFQIDLTKAVKDKAMKNAMKYPVSI